MSDAVISNAPDPMSAELAGLIPKRLPVSAMSRFKEEQQLFEKFGKDAMHLYMKIDGKKTLAELHQTSGFEEKRLLELMDEMEKLGMIKVYTVFELDEEE